ncbi:MAG: O-antigen ligase family protein [Chitinophagales bacterium]|nr:O-antigen ligase family protein [Chitinophagales bacterium]
MNLMHWSNNIWFGSLVMIFAGFSLSRVMLSLGMAGIVLAAVLYVWRKRFSNLFFDKSNIVPAMLWGLVAVSGIWSTDKQHWLNFARIYLPFLFLPVASAILPKISDSWFKKIIWSYTLIFAISVSVVLVNYFIHFETINQSILSGGYVPTPHSHIRYSLLVVMAFFSSLWLYFHYYGKLKVLAALLAIFFFGALHLLSVRSALFSLYAAIPVFLFINRHSLGLKRIFIFFLLSAMGAAIALSTMPSLRNKINYMRYDIMEYLSHKTHDASDGMRLRSWKAGWALARQQPFYGCGYGDIYKEMHRWYDMYYPQLAESQKKLPHNQYLWWWVSIGWSGMILSLAALLFPVAVKWNSTSWMFKVFYVVLLSSFFWEPTLEEQMGSGFCAVWLLLFLQRTKHSHA